MSNKKMIQCKTCGAGIAKNAKVCPSCGAKNKKPIYKRCWLWALVIVFIIGLIPADPAPAEASPSASEQTAQAQQHDPTPSEPLAHAEYKPNLEPEIEYAPYTVKQLLDDLSKNAMKAEQTYQDQYVELTGELSTIDSDGRYVSLIPQGTWGFSSVMCYLQNDEQKAVVLGLKKGGTVTIRGQVTDIGEVLGYILDIDEFVTK